MRVLGVDPGSIVTGWGLVGGDSARPVLIEAGLVRLGGGPPAARLARLSEELAQVVSRLAPDTAAVEAPFHGVNARAALALAHARGAVLAVLGRQGLEVAEYSPATVKKSVTGSGRAPKEQVRGMVARLLHTPGFREPADVSDALAVALCHANCSRFQLRVARGAARRIGAR